MPSPIGLPFHRYPPSNPQLSSARAPAEGFEPPIVALTGRRLTIRPHRSRNSVGMAGFEPAISCSRSRRISHAFPHPDRSAQRESNPHIRLGKAVGFRYIMGTDHSLAPNCQRNRGHRVGLEPTSPHYGCGVFAARRPVQKSQLTSGSDRCISNGTRGARTLTPRLRAGRSATRALVPESFARSSESARKESNLRLPVISRVLSP